jgi:endonuclease/exonuclease/phosphatase family metal-dependent hydrolase
VAAVWAAALAIVSATSLESARADTPPGLEETADDAFELSVLSYNVHGLFGLAAKDSPRDRMPTIGWLANSYDVVLLQEDFEYPDVVAQQMQHAVQYRGNGLAGHPGLLLAKIVSLPVTLLIPRFSPPYGSGLTTFLPRELDLPAAVVRKPYDDCGGWFGSHGDCWARKGVLGVRLRTPGGAEVDVYNTHIEAGQSKRSVRSRRRNFETLTRVIEMHSGNGAVIVGGDFNVDYSRPDDRDFISAFRARLGLRDSGAGPQLAVWRERDFILFRDGNGATISVLEAGEAREFVSGERALSDHPALFARVRLSPAPREVEP